MTFCVDQERKRDWNKGWWRDNARGKAVLALGIVFALLSVPVVVCAVRTWATFDPTRLDNPVGEELAAALWLAAALFCVCMAVAFLWVVFVRVPSYPRKLLSQEVLTIEDGWLTLRCHRRRDLSRDGMEVLTAYLPNCEWCYDKATRKLCLLERGDGAIRHYHYDDPAREKPVPFERMYRYRWFDFYPYYDPDVISEVRRWAAPYRRRRGDSICWLKP